MLHGAAKCCPLISPDYSQRLPVNITELTGYVSFVSRSSSSKDIGIAVAKDDAWVDTASLDLPFALTASDVGTLNEAKLAAVARALETAPAAPINLDTVALLPPITPDARIFCIGLNYADHADERKMQKPEYPVIFLRSYESFVGHARPLIKPHASDAFDYEGEMVAVLSRGGRYLSADDTQAYVAAYSVANEGSIRDYQLRRGPQWPMGKNSDSSVSIGPCLVTADELPPLAKGLGITTRLNGETVQQSNMSSMIFDVAEIVAYVS
ncbi:MAG: fumarylacetoacetate hydrolase family protein [Paraburkholderia tropica]|uniref:fumarylacetoacetate hydrolase family protein n=1 Tax=Paraburkholderia tropica TaxID=92647 RepID=UPI0031015A0D